MIRWYFERESHFCSFVLEKTSDSLKLSFVFTMFFTALPLFIRVFTHWYFERIARFLKSKSAKERLTFAKEELLLSLFKKEQLSEE